MSKVNASRRVFLKTGIVGSLMLAGLVGTRGIFWGGENTKNKVLVFLTDNDLLCLKKIIPVILAHAWDRTSPLPIDKIVTNVEFTIRTLSSHTQQEIKQLFSLLAFWPTRYWMSSISDWSSASYNEVDIFLNQWKNSRWSLFRKAYLALVQLIMGAYYAEPLSWKKIGYPGPPVLAAGIL